MLASTAKHARHHIKAFLTLSVLLFATPSIWADNLRQTGLTAEIERQQHQEWQLKVTHEFQQLLSWFSAQEQTRAAAPDGGIPLNELQPQQLTAVHNLLTRALGDTGYLRVNSLLKLHKVQAEMNQPGHAQPTLLRYQSTDTRQRFALTGPVVNLEMHASHNLWQIDTLMLALWPRQIPPAPEPRLEGSDAHYAFLRWHESVGEDVLGQISQQAIQFLKALPESSQRLAGKGQMMSSLNLRAADRIRLRQLALSLSNHLAVGHSGENPEESIDISFQWQGQLTADNDLLLNLKAGQGLWQIMLTSKSPDAPFEKMPANGAFVAYSHNGDSHLAHWQVQALETHQDSKSVKQEPEPLSEAVPVTLAGGQTEENRDTDTDTNTVKAPATTWLKDPAFLNGMALSLGYVGQTVSMGEPLQPVVMVKREGRPHRNIKVTFSLTENGSEEPWLKDVVMNFEEPTQDYRSRVLLPKSMAGKDVTITFSVHEPGTRFEGLYEYKIQVKKPPGTM